MESLPFVPSLEPKGDIINGMICVCWDNYEEFEIATRTDDGWYEFDYKISHNAYSEWRDDVVDFDMNERDEFYIKVPTQLYPYELQFKFTVSIRQFDEEAEENEDEATDPWMLLADCTSNIYTIEIPSFLIQTSFKKDEIIQYYPPNSLDSCVLPGVITDILQNKKIVVKSLAFDTDGEILTLDSSKLVRDTVDPHLIADIIDQKVIESDLILRTNDEHKHKIYQALWGEINTICCSAMLELAEFDEEMGDFLEMDYVPMSNVIALSVYEYLYLPDYHYRFNCLLGDSHLFLEQQWKYAVSQTLTEYQIEDIAYSCDLCRKQISLFEFAYHCKCNTVDHDFCVSCIHSVLIQYNEMKPFMLKLLKHHLNDHCIEEIVAYCVGRATKFDHHDHYNDHQEEILKQLDIKSMKL